MSNWREAIAEEHAGLRNRLRALLDPREPAELASELASLRKEVEAHFAAEEGEAGLFASLRAAGVASELRIEQLREIHGEIRSLLDEVVELVAMPGASAPVPLLQALVATIAEHEKHESGLLQGSLERDTGGGD